MRVNVGLIGKGKWGRILKLKLTDIANLKFVSGKKNNYLNLITNNHLDWVFVATPNSTHFKIVKNCLNLGINVFCEKPISTNYLEAKKLFQIAKKNRVKLYISDVYSFHNKKIKKIFSFNKVFRSKNIKGKDNEFLYRFMYHDISIMFDFFRNYKIKSVEIDQSKKKKFFQINLKFKNDKIFLFKYHLKSKTKDHYINNHNFITKNDILKKMLKSLLYEKINIKKNNKKALFILKFLDIIKKYF
jgi:hypothetical protein